MDEIVVDLDTGRPIVYRGLILTGECNQCGWCCHFHPKMAPGVPYPNMRTKACSYLYSNDGVKHMCAIYDKRPMGCVFFPLPDHEIGPTCGFRWVSKAVVYVSEFNRLMGLIN